MSDDDNVEREVEQEHDDETAPKVEPTAEVGIDKSDDGEGPTPVAGRQSLVIPVMPAVLVLALLAAGGLAAWLYFSQYRPDQATNETASQSAVDAARSGVTAILSYKPETVDQDFAAAKSHLAAGDFLNQYDALTTKVLTPAAKEKGVATAGQVVGAAVTELNPNSAVVLVFVNQVTTSKERPDPQMESSTELVSLTKVQGTWLINKFDPV